MKAKKKVFLGFLILTILVFSSNIIQNEKSHEYSLIYSNYYSKVPISTSANSFIIENFTQYHYSSQNVTYDNNLLKLIENDSIYQALYNFKNDTIGGDPSGWSISEGAFSTIDVVEELHGHGNAVQLETAASDNCQMQNPFSTHRSGIVEFYILSNNSQEQVELNVFPEAGVGNYTKITMVQGKFRYLSGGWYDICDALSNNLYHVKISYNDSIGWHVYFNGTRYPSSGEYGFNSALRNYAGFEFSTSFPIDPFYAMVDAVDYSWADGYYEGRNLRLEANHSDGYYISDEILINLGNNVQISNVTINSELESNSSVNMEFYDFNTDRWKPLLTYVGTKQAYFRFKMLLNTTQYSNVNISAVTLFYNDPMTVSPNPTIISVNGEDLSEFLLSPLGLGIISAIVAMLVIITAILMRYNKMIMENNATIKELNKKIGTKRDT